MLVCFHFRLSIGFVLWFRDGVMVMVMARFAMGVRVKVRQVASRTTVWNRVNVINRLQRNCSQSMYRTMCRGFVLLYKHCLVMV